MVFIILNCFWRLKAIYFIEYSLIWTCYYIHMFKFILCMFWSRDNGQYFGAILRWMSTSYLYFVATTDLGRDTFEPIKKPLLHLLHFTPWLWHSLILPKLILWDTNGGFQALLAFHKELCLIYLVTYNQSIYYELLFYSMNYSPLLSLLILILKLSQSSQ